jgi:hypothetical protein
MTSREIAAAAIALATAACGSVEPHRDVECGAQPVEVLPNGSFDASTPVWAQEPAAPNMLCGQADGITPFDGALSGCLGRTDGTTRTLTQQVPLPEGGKSVVLSGQICITTQETQAVDHDVLTFDLLDGDTVVAALGQMTNQNGADMCQFTTFQKTGTLTGDPVTATLRLRSTLDTAMPTSFFMDALSVKISCQ